MILLFASQAIYFLDGKFEKAELEVIFDKAVNHVTDDCQSF